MSRFFKNLIPFIAPIVLLVCVFFAPHTTHAAWLDIVDTGTTFVGNLLSSVLEIFLMPLASVVMYLGGMLLDGVIKFSLNTSYIFSLSPAINLGWVIVRDLCNIFFIFILIYISLGTIVKGTSFGTKDLLIKVVIAAILINFSLFFTKTIIDVSNIFGNWLYGGIVNTLRVNSENQSQPTSLSGLIATRLGIIQYGQSNAIANANPNTDKMLSTAPSQSFTGRILRLAIVLIATYMFFYTSVLFLTRSVTLLFLLVFSPIWFMGDVLPQLKDYASDWKKELTAAVTFPIAYLLTLYIALQFINSLDALGTVFPDGNIKGSEFTVAQYFNYFVIILLLQACLSAAKDSSGKLGKMADGLASGLAKFATNAGIGIASGGIALAGRSAAAFAFAEKGKGFDAFKTTAKSGLPIINRFGTTKDLWKDTKKELKDGSYDIRNFKVPGMGKSSVASTLSGISGVDIKTKTAKEYSDEKKDYQKEIKIESDILAVLKEIESVEKAKADLASGAITAAAYDTFVSTAKGNIYKKTSKMSNQDIELVTRRAQETSDNLAKKSVIKSTPVEVFETYTSSLKHPQINHIASSTEINPQIKKSVTDSRLFSISNVLASVAGSGVTYKTGSRLGDMRLALGQLTPGEVAKLPISSFNDPELLQLIRPEHLKKIAEEYDYTQRTRLRESIERDPAHSAHEWLKKNTEGQLF